MIQPQFKLPIKQVLRSFRYKIIDERGTEIIDNIDNLQNSLFIEESCNNINPSIKIIKQAKINLVTLIYLTPTGDKRNELTNQMEEIESFLNNLNINE